MLIRPLIIAALLAVASCAQAGPTAGTPGGLLVGYTLSAGSVNVVAAFQGGDSGAGNSDWQAFSQKSGKQGGSAVLFSAVQQHFSGGPAPSNLQGQGGNTGNGGSYGGGNGGNGNGGNGNGGNGNGGGNGGGNGIGNGGGNGGGDQPGDQGQGGPGAELTFPFFPAAGLPSDANLPARDVPASGTVPEPATGALLLIGLCCASLARRRRPH